MKDINKKYSTPDNKASKSSTIVREAKQPYCGCCKQKKKRVSPRKEGGGSPNRRGSNNAITPVNEVELDKLPQDPIKLLMFAINRRNRQEGQRKSRVLDTIGEFSRF